MSIRSQRALFGVLSWIAGGAACASSAEAAPEAQPACALAPPSLAIDEALHDAATAPRLPPPTSALGRVLGSSELRACVRSEGLAGFDVALATEIANQISIDYKHALKTEWIVVSAGERMKRLQDGACDILVAAVSHTNERAAQIATSKIYLQTDAEGAESYVVGVRNGSADLEAAVNRALDDLARSGRIALLHRRWM